MSFVLCTMYLLFRKDSKVYIWFKLTKYENKPCYTILYLRISPSFSKNIFGNFRPIAIAMLTKSYVCIYLMIFLVSSCSMALWMMVTSDMLVTLQMSLLIRNWKSVMLMTVRFLWLYIWSKYIVEWNYT